MAKQINITMQGHVYEAQSNQFYPAKNQDADKVHSFFGDALDGCKNYFRVDRPYPDDAYQLTTPKGVYKLEKHPKFNYWHCQANSTKIHFMPKKVKGTLTYWA